MRVVVDYQRCEGNAVCMSAAPKVFKITPADDQVHLLQERPSETLREDVEEAARLCPRAAISIENE